MVTVQELHVYPLKSARGIPRNFAQVAETGLQWDRHWMLTDANGKFISQRTHPLLARIQTEVTDEGLVLRVADGAPLVLPLAPEGTSRQVQVWKDECEGLDQGDEAGAWASNVLGEPIRVVRIPQQSRRIANPQFAGPVPAPVSFSDAFPILVCNRASLDELNRRMPEPVPIGRFRPNVVIEGLPPFAEDQIAALRIGSVTLKLVKPSTRCIITSTDQSTGERTTNPLPVLRAFRFNRELMGVTFGENAIPVTGIGERIERGAKCDVVFD